MKRCKMPSPGTSALVGLQRKTEKEKGRNNTSFHISPTTGLIERGGTNHAVATSRFFWGAERHVRRPRHDGGLCPVAPRGTCWGTLYPTLCCHDCHPRYLVGTAESPTRDRPRRTGARSPQSRLSGTPPPPGLSPAGRCSSPAGFPSVFLQAFLSLTPPDGGHWACGFAGSDHTAAVKKKSPAPRGASTQAVNLGTSLAPLQGAVLRCPSGPFLFSLAEPHTSSRVYRNSTLTCLSSAASGERTEGEALSRRKRR